MISTTRAPSDFIPIAKASDFIKRTIATKAPKKEKYAPEIGGWLNEKGEKVYTSGQSFVPIFIVVAIIMIVSVLVLVITTNENKLLRQTNIKDDEPQTNEQKAKIFSLFNSTVYNFS